MGSWRGGHYFNPLPPALGWLARRYTFLYAPFTAGFGLLYTIPSLALFGVLLVPLARLGDMHFLPSLEVFAGTVGVAVAVGLAYRLVAGRLPIQRLEAVGIDGYVLLFTLAATMLKKANGRVDGLVVEMRSAGGHNAPPRGKVQLSGDGEPIYGERDAVDIEKLRELGVPLFDTPTLYGFGANEELVGRVLAPPRSVANMPRPAAWDMRNVPRTLTLSPWAKRSRGISDGGAPQVAPLLLTTISRLPNSSSAAATTRSTSSGRMVLASSARLCRRTAISWTTPVRAQTPARRRPAIATRARWIPCSPTRAARSCHDPATP